MAETTLKVPRMPPPKKKKKKAKFGNEVLGVTSQQITKHCERASSGETDM